MPFQYLGNVKSLVKEVEENKEKINSAYLRLFGKEKFGKIRDLSYSLLSPNCFFESDVAFYNQMGYSGAEMSSGTGSSVCHFPTNIDMSLNQDCSLRANGGKISVAFTISEDSLRRGRSFIQTQKIISGYIHEFDHFIVSGLQKNYLDLTHAIIGAYVGNVGNPEKLMRVVENIGNGNNSVEDKERGIALAGLACQYNTFCEQATRILDKNVLDSIGINYDLPWRNKEPEYGKILVTPSPKMTLEILIDGDPFNGLSDADAIDKMINWEDFFQPPCDSAYSRNLLNSLKNINIRLVPFRDLVKDMRKKLRKKLERR